MDKGLASKETVVLRRWGVETNVCFIKTVDEVVWPLVLKQRLETTRLSLNKSLFFACQTKPKRLVSLRRKCCLCSDICKWLDFLVFSDKDN